MIIYRQTSRSSLVRAILFRKSTVPVKGPLEVDATLMMDLLVSWDSRSLDNPNWWINCERFKLSDIDTELFYPILSRAPGRQMTPMNRKNLDEVQRRIDRQRLVSGWWWLLKNPCSVPLPLHHHHSTSGLLQSVPKSQVSKLAIVLALGSL